MNITESELDEWALRLAEGSLTSDDEDQLVRLLHEGPEQTDTLFECCRFEALLLARRRNDKLVAAVAAGIATAAAQASVDAIVSRLPKHAPRTYALPRLWRGLGISLVVTLGTIGVWQASRTGPANVARKAYPSVQSAATVAPRASAESNDSLRSQQAQTALIETPPEAIAKTQVFSIDFEGYDVLEGTVLNYGAITDECPPLVGSRVCALGGIHHQVPRSYAVTVAVKTKSEPSMGSFDHRRILTFDYFIGTPGQTQTNTGHPEKLVIQLKDREQRQNHKLVLANARLGKWSRALARVSDLKPISFKDQPIQDGDALLDFTIIGGTIGSDLFYLDNIRFVEISNTPLPQSSADLDLNEDP
jgi:hypothetical protein